VDQARQALALNCGLEDVEGEYRMTAVGAEMLETHFLEASEGWSWGAVSR